MENETDTEFLARMMVEGFSSLRQEMYEGFDALRKEFQAINQRLDDYIAPTLDDHARRIKDLELARQ